MELGMRPEFEIQTAMPLQLFQATLREASSSGPRVHVDSPRGDSDFLTLAVT